MSTYRSIHLACPAPLPVTRVRPLMSKVVPPDSRPDTETPSRDLERAELGSHVAGAGYGLLCDDPSCGGLVFCLEHEDSGVLAAETRARQDQRTVIDESLHPV